MSEPIINRSTGKPVIAVATPIWCNGKVTGLFGATILITSCHKGLRYLPLLSNGKKSCHKEKNNRRSSGKRAENNVQFIA